METDFPKYEASYLSAKSFQDKEIPVTYKGWKKKGNEDRVKDGKVVMTWKEQLIYQLRYSFPQYRVDQANEQILDKDGKPMKNSNYDPAFPKGYTVVYCFNEGELECGSLPLYNEFRIKQPKVGDKLLIKRTGKDKETIWSVRKVEKVIKDSFEESLEPDEECPF